jgi:hypothetical protein
MVKNGQKVGSNETALIMAPCLYHTLARKACARQHAQVHKSAPFQRKCHSFIILHCIWTNKLYNSTVIARQISITFTSRNTSPDLPKPPLSPFSFLSPPSSLLLLLPLSFSSFLLPRHPPCYTSTKTSHQYSTLAFYPYSYLLTSLQRPPHHTITPAPPPRIVYNERQAQTIRQSSRSHPVSISWHQA